MSYTACMTLRIAPIPSRPGYLACSDGTIIGKRGNPLRQAYGTNGYLVFRYSEPGKRGLTVNSHVAICEAFNGLRPEGHEVAHRNGSRDDNRAENLRWKTAQQNAAEKRQHGTHVEGSRQWAAKLSEADVRLIRASSESNASLARRFGVSHVTIFSARNGHTWKHVQ
jgi:hypothetical protein